VIGHTDSSTALMIAGTTAAIDALAKDLSGDASQRTVLTLALDGGLTPVQAVNAAIEACFPSDVVLVGPGIEVTASWLERLGSAATSDSTVASATPLSIGGGALELFADPGERREISSGIDALAERVSRDGSRLRPRIATLGPGCAYIRRAALELIGPLKATLPLDDALADFALRAVGAGMVHVGADDVLVGSTSWASAAADDGSPETLEGRVRQTIENDEQGRLPRSIAVARVALRPLSVTIDGRSLVSAVGGTQTYVLDLVLALAREPRVSLRVLVPPDLSEHAGNALTALADVELLSYEQALGGARLTDVVHRPQPIFTADDLALLRLVGERIVIGQQDLISYHNYSYHRDVDAWRTFRRTTRLALAAADQVIFFSEHARRDALAEDLLPDGRTHVVGVGADALESPTTPVPPPDGQLPEGPFVLCLGADYAHKNRPFAIELLASLRERGWAGRLVLAGSHVPFGSSRAREQELLDGNPGLAGRVSDLGPVDEPTKVWLSGNARALVYPTIYEGLGLLPLEAARLEVPCLFAAQASLSELAGHAATLVPWDADASAAAVKPLLDDGSARADHIAALQSLSVPSWREVAEQLLAVYERAVAEPPPEAAPRSWQELDREAYISRIESEMEHLRGVAQEYQDAYHALEDRVGAGLHLIERDGLLSEAQQRGLLRIGGRRRLGALLLSPFALLGRGKANDRGEHSQDAAPS
jgi:glycosyltransferase involved in cell wall biosynthesis